MKTLVILGAGQMGKNAELLLNRKEDALLAPLADLQGSAMIMRP